ncbi:hypothetical protein AB3N60_01010 [Leptospira sp. WS39.C2]
MEHSYTCPNCQTNVSFMRVMSYPPPFTMKCKECNKRMQVENSPIVTFAVLLSYFMGFFLYLGLNFFKQIVWIQDLDDTTAYLLMITFIFLVTEGIIYILYKFYSIQLVKESSWISKHNRWTLLVPITLVLYLIYFFNRN